MNTKTKHHHMLYEFKASEPPTDSPLTLDKWMAWHKSEMERLEQMRQAGREALAEGMAAQFERDVNGLPQH